MVFDVKPITTSRATCCGPASLKMLLDYYGTEVDLDVLIKETETGIAGASLKNLRRAAVAHGLDAVCFNMDAEELVRQDRPAVIWWRFAHFIVFSGVDDNEQVVVCDPMKGRYRMSFGLFKSLYSGVSMWNGAPEDLAE